MGNKDKAILLIENPIPMCKSRRRLDRNGFLIAGNLCSDFNCESAGVNNTCPFVGNDSKCPCYRPSKVNEYTSLVRWVSEVVRMGYDYHINTDRRYIATCGTMVVGAFEGEGFLDLDVRRV